MMGVLRWQVARWGRRLGWPGVVGVALAVYAVVLYGAALLPSAMQLAEKQQQLAALQAEVVRQATEPDAPSAEARLAAFYQSFPAPDSAPVWLEKLYAAAGKESLVLDSADYKLTPDKSGRLMRYAISLPVRGSYLQVRRFMRAALEENPALAVSDIHLKRDAIGSPSVDARLQFVLYLRAT